MSLVITGNPGVGKHTISKHVAKDLNYEIIDINKIALKTGFYNKKNKTLDVDVIQLKKYLKKNIPKKSLVVGHLAPYVVSKSQVKFAIILRKNPYKLITIYKKRNYSNKKITENVGSEILGTLAYDSIKNFGKNKTRQIDTTNKSVSKISNIIKAILKGKSVDETVDWLSLVSKKDELKKFFSY